MALVVGHRCRVTRTRGHRPWLGAVLVSLHTRPLSWRVGSGHKERSLSLEYRIVDNHLILLDVDAAVVLDYVFDVMCARC